VRYGSLCTGIGGLDLAVEAHFGAEPSWVAEYEDHLDPILQRHFGPILNLRDLTTVAWDELEPVDILTAGYPCQPFSTAGKRQGADDARHLWPYIMEAVRVLRPRWLVCENVAGHLTLGFGDVLRDLAEAGFDAEWCVLRASDVGAPHRRARLFFVACSDSTGSQGTQPARRRDVPAGSDRPSAADTASGRVENGAIGRDNLLVGSVDRTGHRDRPGHHAEGDCGTDRPGVMGWGRYGPAVTRWERTLGRRSPHPLDDRGRLNPAFVEWMMGYPAGWVDGLTRTQALRALGNAVVQQQAALALDVLVPAHLEVAA
jgi:DNA (cytosine-5)-methyltransferase 1